MEAPRYGRVTPIEDVERNIIGAILIDAKQFDPIHDIINSSDFTITANQQIFACMEKLRGLGITIDMLHLEPLLLENWINEDTPFYYMGLLARNTAYAANGPGYAAKLKEMGTRNVLNLALERLSHSNMEGKALPELLELASKEIGSIVNSGTVPVKKSLGERLNEFLTNLDDNMSGNGPVKLDTGYPGLDNVLKGMRPGNLVIIAGRPSMGKTTFAINIARNILLAHSKPLQFFSYEMGDLEILRSFLCCTGSIPLEHLKGDQKDLPPLTYERLTYAIAQLQGHQLDIQTSNPTIGTFKREVRLHKKLCPTLNVVVIDYLQLMNKTGSNENRTLEIAAITRDLKQLARELNIVIICLSQLNRNVDSRPGSDKSPILSDLRDSGSIEQDSDIVMFVQRDDKDTRIIVAKNRSGPVGEARLVFDGATATFKPSGFQN